jgi:hypothetical protein
MQKKYHDNSLTHLSEQQGHIFAQEWLDAWNSQDIERLLHYYADDFIMHSPTVNEFIGKSEGLLMNKIDLRSFYEKIFKEIPDLKFKLMTVAVGIKNLTIYYFNKNCGLFIDVFEFDSGLKISRSYAHY